MLLTADNSRAKTLFASLLVFFVFFAIGWYVINSYESFLKQQQRGNLERTLSAKSSSLTQAIDRHFALLYGVRAYVVTTFKQFNEAGHSSNPEAVDLFLKEIFTTVPDIRSISISPGGIHRHIYPVNESTRKVIGHNLLTDKRPHVREKNKQIIASRRLGISGPYPLRESGSLGLIARLPIYQDDQFWGFTVMVLNVPQMLISAGVEQTGDFAIRVAGGDSFYGDSGVFENNPLIETISLPDGQWEVAMSPDTQGLTTSIKGFLFVLNGIFALLASSLCFIFKTRHYYLQIEVEKVTSDLKTQGDSLRDSEEHFRRGIMNAPFPIMIHAEDGEVVRLNNTWTKLSGYTHSDIPTISDWTLKAYGQKMDAVQKVIDSLFESDTTVHEGEFTVRTKSGETQVWDFSSAPLGKTTNDRRLIISTAVDTTERKKTESERAKLESQLHQAQKIESIGQLAGGIAHDFNNILAGLYGNVSLAKSTLTKTLPDHPGFRYLEAAEKSMNRATALTNQLLTFSKGGVPLKETISLIHLIEEVVPFNLSGSNVKPVISKPDNLWLASIDQGQIQQVFGNLTINAMQAMPNGGELQITLENAEILDSQLLGLDEGKYIWITLADNGTGIDPEHLERIFEPYFTTKHAGSGLGLATVYSIIKKHGGHISVTSQLGQGTTFALYLPVAKDQTLQSAPTVSVTAPLQQTARVLVMDDEEMICDIVKAMLEDAGHTVETVEDGKLALDRYRQALETDNPFDLVILDLTIPGGMGGKEVVKQILSLHPLAKVIVSSGYADDPLMAHYADYGFKAVVPKPFELTVLVDTVNKVLMSD